MKISEKQLQMLMVILQDAQKNIAGLFSYDLEIRNRLLNDIINQQDTELMDIKQKKINPNFQINEYGDDDFATPPPGKPQNKDK